MLAAALGGTGAALLCLSQLDQEAASSTATLAGVLLGLVAGATYATYSWAAHRLIHDGISRAASMGAVFGAGGALLLPVLVLTGAPLIATPQAFAVAAYMALVPMFLGYVLFGYGLTRVPASTATTITLTEPAIAAILAVAVVGERLTPVGWTGLGIIAAVLFILALTPTNTTADRHGRTPTSEAIQPALAPSPRRHNERTSPRDDAGRGSDVMWVSQTMRCQGATRPSRWEGVRGRFRKPYRLRPVSPDHGRATCGERTEIMRPARGLDARSVLAATMET